MTRALRRLRGHASSDAGAAAELGAFAFLIRHGEMTVDPEPRWNAGRAQREARARIEERGGPRRPWEEAS